MARYTCVALQRLNGSAKKVKGTHHVSRLGNLLLIHIDIGSLFNENIRLEMDNSIFRKLQDAIEHPCRSKEWFGMSEQAINTIYALAQRPDVLCDAIIRNLTRRAFAPKKSAETPAASQDPDAMVEDDGLEEFNHTATQSEDITEKDVGDAFELSQLLFVIGHVAIKHIVYLELVEREWKRQKHEREQGKSSTRHYSYHH